MYEVILWLPCILGDGCSCCLTCLGGYESNHQIMIKWSKTIIYWSNIRMPEGYWSGGVLWGWPNILWFEGNNYLPNG